MNLIRERHMYKRSYEVLQELVEIQQTGNLFHKLAFGILGDAVSRSKTKTAV